MDATAVAVEQDMEHNTVDRAANTASEPDMQTETTAVAAPAAKKKLPPKRKVAMHLAYLGKGYHVSDCTPGLVHTMEQHPVPGGVSPCSTCANKLSQPSLAALLGLNMMSGMANA